MIITTILGDNYSAIFLSNDTLSEEKLAAYAGCKVQVVSTFVRSRSIQEGFYFLPDGSIVQVPPYGYCSAVPFSDVQAWKELNNDGRVYGRECGTDKCGDDFYSCSTPLASSLI